MASRQNPISFKTVPNRNKTQKWQQAKTYNYDGDDWGGYDPYDEYAYEDPPQQPPMPQMPPPQQYSQSQSFARPPLRQNSFDQGDERRNFSAGPVMYGAESRTSGSPARSNVGGDDYSDGRPRSRPRDFTNPEQVPPPLNMRGSPAQASFPPRKSSVSSGSPAPEVAPKPAVRKEDKELPIPPVIRPSDIYRRMEAEREKERQSMESSRPSMDSLQREAESSQSQTRPLSSVQEDFGEPVDKGKASGPPMLPSMRNMSGIGTSFLHGSSEAEPTTRAPDGKDPAAEIMSERAETRAPSGRDPASEILAERAATRAHPGSDPAADIMAERGQDPAVPEPESGVEHHYRSIVDQAFDNDSAQNSASLSRDSSVYSQSVGGTGMSRNNSNSTAGISPIMSRVPSAATAKMQQAERDRQVPTIAEEPSQRASPAHSRNVSAGSGELYHPGYRRSLDPPSGDNSPARTPGLENAHSRRVSQPMSAEPATADPPAVPDQGVEMMPGLEPGETPATEAPTPAAEAPTRRPRAGTDYSMRESDMARELSTSPEKNEFSPSIAQAATAEQTAFLQEHASTPTSQWPPTPASGRSSPAKGRVREIAGKYQTIEAESRRGSVASSKSSWSNFRGSDENLPGLKKRPTGESGLGSEMGQAAGEARPGMASQMSYRPGLPGQWVSYAGTPGETPASVEEATSRDVEDAANLQPSQQEEVPDFSPTTNKQQLPGHSPSTSQQDGFLAQAKDVGEALGASVISKVGIGHQTRDFASAEPPAPVEQPSSHRPTGDVGQLNAPDRPELGRVDTEASMATDIASSASSVPPTPPVKDDVGAQHGQAPRQRQLQEEGRPISNYFSGAVAPLQPNKGHSRDASANLDLPKLGPMTNMSTDTREGDLESDRLRREIVRSLSPSTSREDNAALTQDALDAPDNMRKAESGQSPDPPAESTERPGLGLLNQRFSWEDRADNKGVLDSSPAASRTTRDVPTVREPESDPEVVPEMPYERPRSRQLHIVNPEGDDSSDDGKIALQQTPPRTLNPEEKGIVSPFTPSQENLRDGLDSRDISRDNMSPDALSPAVGSGLEIVDSKDSSDGGSRVPSYYTQGQPDNLTSSKSLPLTQQNPVPEPASPTTPQTALPVEPSAPTSPTAATDTPAAAPSPPTSKPRSTTLTQGGKIPPFREILATKDSARRMDMYRETRATFAATDTGLGGWLEGMLARHPEHAQLGTRLQPSGTSLGVKTTGLGHKHSPSLAKFKSLGSSFGTSGDGEGSGGLRRTSTTKGESSSGAPPALPPKDAVWEQRGKDLMKGAGVLGGKAQAGAKGLLMKGRSRFGTKRESGSGSGAGGGEKALPPPPPFPAPSSPSPAPSTSRSTTMSSASNLLAPSATASEAPPDSLGRRPSPLARSWSRLRRSGSKASKSSGSRPPSLRIPAPEPVRADVAPWSEPGEGRDQGTGDAEAMGRLGVLPSPTATAFTASPTKSARGRQRSAVEEVLAGASVLGRGEGEEDVCGSTARGAADGGVYEELQRGWGSESEEEREVEARPAFVRVGSDRAGLPSQVRGVGITEATSPPSQRLLDREEGRGLEDDGEAEMESTPRQGDFPARVRGSDGEDSAVGSGYVTAADEEDEARELLTEDVEPRAPSGVTSPGSFPEISSASDVQRERAGSDASRGLSTTADQQADPGGTSSSTQDWEKVSDVSSEEHFQDATDGRERDLAPSARRSTRSSVSSLAGAAAAAPLQAGAGVLQSDHLKGDEVVEDESSMIQSDRSADERPMSYIALGETEGGAPAQETIDGSGRFENASVDLSGISGPPPGLQQHQQYQTMQDQDVAGLPGDHGGLRSPPPAPDTAPPTFPEQASRSRSHGRQVSAETREKSSRRMSGLFRSSRRSSQNATTTTTTVYGPAPSAISDQYGLENLPTGPAAIARPSEMQQTRRRSGIWSSFKRSSVVLPDDSRQSSIAGPPAAHDVEPPSQQLWGFEEPRPNTLKKPQRASTSAAAPPDPAKKKQRFSGLGSLFGRSSTTGHKSERPRKLVKQQQQQPQASTRNASSSQVPVTGSVATGYEAFEEARRRQAREKLHSSSTPVQISMPRQERADLTTAALGFPHREQAAPDPAGYGEPEPQYRRLHSERPRDEMPLEKVPEAFRPVEASFGGRAAPVGPPPLPMASPPPSQPRSPPPQWPVAAGSYPSPDHGPYSPSRQLSYGSNEYPASVQAPHHYGTARFPPPPSSPAHSRAASDAYPYPRDARLGSIDNAMAHPGYERNFSPDQQQQQQRPWAVTLPDYPSGERASPPIGIARGGGEADYPPFDEQSTPHVQLPMPRLQSPPAQERRSSVPYSRPLYPYAAQQHQRYHSLPQPQPRPPTDEYIGRRDEPEGNPEEIMRGVSYPGQEWVPGRDY